MKKVITLVSVAVLGAIVAGCQSGTPTTGSRVGDGAVVGGLAGAAVGGIAGGWEGAAIGAGVGALGGAIIADATGRCYWVDQQGRKHYTACR